MVFQLRKLACAGCIWLCLPANVAAQAAGATVQASGAVTINGSPVRQSSVLLVNDRLLTGSNGKATLTALGVNARAGHQTSLLYAVNSIELDCGVLQVSSVKEFTLRLHGGVSVAPAAGQAIFEAVQSGNKLRITAKKGILAVAEGGKQSTLASGKVFSRVIAECSNPLPSGFLDPAVAAAIAGETLAPVFLNRGRAISPARP